MKWWSPPKQRQRWGEARILPSDDRGQIFFDLFYVAGAYNLGNVIKNSGYASGDGGGAGLPRITLYFCAAGLPAMSMWHDKLMFDARFTTRPGRDACHRSLEILQLCCVATALSRIRSVEVESHPCNQIDMFEFASAVFLNSVLTIGRYAEVAACVIGDPAARTVAKREVTCRIIPSLFLLGATIESGASYFSPLAGAHDDDCEVNENPVWLCLASWASSLMIGYCNQVVFAPKHSEGYQAVIEATVPLNVHFCMHRYGEWFMLMFGESIMSLLIVEGDNESFNHSVKFYCGVLSVIILAQLHFQSEPKVRHHQQRQAKTNGKRGDARDGEDHALSRSRHSNYLYAIFVPVYSLALIALGICYKMFLYDYQDRGERGRRGLGGGAADYAAAAAYYNDGNESYQTNGGYAENKQQFAADLFSRSIAAVLICTDLNVLLHRGRDDVLDQIRSMPNVQCNLLMLAKGSLLIFLGAMSALRTDPDFLASVGLAAVLFQRYLMWSLNSWRRKEPGEAGRPIHDDDTDSDGSDEGESGRGGPIAYSDDADYQFEIEVIEEDRSALAKFERGFGAGGEAVGGSSPSPSPEADAGPATPNPDPDAKITDSYQQFF